MQRSIPRLYELPGFKADGGILYNGAVLVGYVLVTLVVVIAVFVVVHGAV